MIQTRGGSDGGIEHRHSLCLIDLGFSPKWTMHALGQIGCCVSQVDTVLLTHLDMDHCHPRWSDGLPRHAEVFVPRGHLPRAYQRGLHRGVLAHFAGQGRQPTNETATFTTLSGLHVEALMTFHDELGSAVFRVSVPVWTGGGERQVHLGYATDLGRATDELLGFLSADAVLPLARGAGARQPGLFDAMRLAEGDGAQRPRLDVLAIESNYCPQLQAASDRPMFLKQRITGGRGHLSNQESAEIACRATPRMGAFLLHLSRVCNRPTLALEAHQQAMAAMADRWEVIATDQIEATGWMSLVTGEMQPRVAEVLKPGDAGCEAGGAETPQSGQTASASLGLPVGR
jgi:phosphoribosyl 1,2-cyclic phosphodiesterase